MCRSDAEILDREGVDDLDAILAVTNTVGSTISRECDAALYTRGGPEVAPGEVQEAGVEAISDAIQLAATCPKTRPGSHQESIKNRPRPRVVVAAVRRRPEVPPASECPSQAMWVTRRAPRARLTRFRNSSCCSCKSERCCKKLPLVPCSI